MKQWSYYVNPFMLTGLSSFKKAVKISEFTNDKLAAQTTDPFFGDQYLTYHPLHTALVTAYNAWVANGGTQKGSTALVDELFKQLTTLVEGWDLTVQGLYRKGTPDYIAIFPHGHKDFNKGAIEQRIGALDSFALRLGSYASLAAVRTAAVAEHTVLDEARIAQEGNKGIKAVASHELEHATNEAMVGLFAFYGAGIREFPSDPTHIAPFFDEATIRNPQQTEFTNHCAPLAHKYIFKRTMPDDTLIKCTNTGSTAVDFYFARLKNEGPGATKINLAAGDSQTYAASAYGHTHEKPFFCVHNPDDTNGANFIIEIM